MRLTTRTWCALESSSKKLRIRTKDLPQWLNFGKFVENQKLAPIIADLWHSDGKSMEFQNLNSQLIMTIEN